MTSFKQKKDHIVAEFGENTNHEICDLLIGADGAGSTVRQQLLPEALPCYSGYVALGCLFRRASQRQNYWTSSQTSLPTSLDIDAYFVILFLDQWRVVCSQTASELG